MRITKNGQLIQSVEDWFRYAPPKGGADQWRDGRSAKEFARAWVESGSVSVPDELVALLSSHPDTQSAVLENGEPEARLAFDKRVGEVRNADLAVRAVSGSAPLALTIEAKADEPFDQLLPDTPQMRSIAFSSAGAAVALTGCVISRRPYCLLPGEGCLHFVYCDTSC